MKVSIDFGLKLNNTYLCRVLEGEIQGSSRVARVEDGSKPDARLQRTNPRKNAVSWSYGLDWR